MEENKETINNVENVENDVENKEKKFTQAEFNDALKKEVERKTKNMPSKEQLEEFKKWQEEQKTEQENQAEKEKEYMQKDNTINELKQQIEILRSGVNAEDSDYVLYKVSKMEGEFADNLKQYLADNPKFTTKGIKATGIESKSTPKNIDDGVTTILKARHPELFE